MDTNNFINMKVADLRKELKVRGLSVNGNKSELVARLESALVSIAANSSPIPDKDYNEDDDDVLGSDILDGGSEGDPKGDEALIDDLLGNGTNDQNTATSTTNKSTPTILKRTNAITIAPKADTLLDKNSAENTNVLSNNKSVPLNVLQTENAKSLSASERLNLRAKKFGDNSLSVRAERFGLTQSETTDVLKNSSKTVVASVTKSNDDEKLKKRAERFGAVVSTAMKKIDQKEKLLKRKERFGALVVNTANAPTATKLKRTKDSTKDDEMKKQRLERFGGI